MSFASSFRKNYLVYQTQQAVSKNQFNLYQYTSTYFCLAKLTQRKALKKLDFRALCLLLVRHN